ncbi:MAG: response regulator [Capnocytophaga sp.]|nr:response regulator [Capnocytophaga sp.]
MVFCQEESNYYFKRISIEHGLSQSGVTTIVRDYKGVLWIGTRQGINRVERNHIKKYTEYYIFHLYEDAQQQLWAVTNNGVLLYEPKEDIFIPKTKQPLFSIAGSHLGVFFGGYSAIYQYNSDTKIIERLPLLKEEKAKDKECLITQIIPINEDIFLIGTENDGIFQYSRKTHLFTSFIEEAKPLSALFYEEKQNNIYFSVFQKGLFQYSASGVFLAHYHQQNTALPNDIILDIKPYRGNIWLATDGGGISILNPENHSFRNIQHSAGNVHSLPVNSITTLYEDANHNMWAGTVRDGVFLFQETYIKTYIDSALGKNNGLSERAVISIFEAENGKVWIGTDGGGINEFDPKTDHFTHHLATYNDKITSITNFSPQQLLVSIYGKGLFLYHINNQTYTPFLLIDENINQEECHTGFTPFVYRISKNNILITAKNSYLYHIDNKQFTKIPFENNLSPKNALQLKLQKDDTLFFSKGNILYQMKEDEATIRFFLSLNEDCAISAVCYDKAQNTLWIGSSNGLFSYSLDTKKLNMVTTNHMFRQISYMQLDNQERLWINASNVLFSYHIPDKKIMIRDDSDGFLPNDVLTGYVQTSGKDFIYMGGVGGFVKINPSITSDTDTNPLLFVQNIDLNGKIYTAENFPKEIPPYFNTLKINVGLNEKNMFRKILFRFKIKNNSQTSVIETYDNSLDIISLLSVGKYQVEVACMTKNGYWTEDVPLLTFEVLPVWYQRFWFIFLVILTILAISAGIMWGYFRRKKQQLKWQMALHQQEMNEDKIQFLTNVSHELRTPLTLIYAPLKRLLNSNEIEQFSEIQKNQLQSAFRQANTMKNIINWVLDYNRSTSLENTLQKTYTDLNHLLTDSCKDFEQELEAKNIHFVLLLDKNLPLIEVDIPKIRVVISNLLMNALKFSNEHSSIRIQSSYNERFIRFQIENTGIGLRNIDMDKLFTRFVQGKHNQKGSGIGLAYCKELIDKHLGNIGAYEENKQTIFYVELPYLSNEKILDKFENEKAHSQAPEKLVNTIDTSLYSVLLVDDNLDFLHYLHSELRSMFKNVTKATNGQEALLVLKTHQPDIIISDVMMPVMNGYQLCKEVKDFLPISHIPVILLTAKNDNESQKIGYKLGADAYLSKPFDMELLLSVISNLLKQKEAIKQRYDKETLLPSPIATTISNADEVFMIKLNEVVKTHYNNIDLDVDTVADAMAMSRASIYNKMKQITGIGINEYINKYRIEIACHLLKQTDKSITDIAFETGFNSQKYFSTLFKQSTGKTPKEYRNNTETQTS